MSNKKKILFLSLSGIGNYLMQTPVFRAVKENMPETEITLWVGPRNTYGLARANGDIDEVIKAPLKRPLPGHVRQVLRLRRKKFDIGIMLYPGQLWKGAGYMFFAGIKKRVGHKYPHLGNPESRLFLTDSIEVAENTHDREQNLLLLKMIGIERPVAGRAYCLDIPEKNKRLADNIVKTMENKIRKKVLIGMHPGTAEGYNWKRWPVENFIETGKQLVKKKEAHIVIFGSSSEIVEMKKIRQALGKENSTIVNRKLLTTVGVIGHCDLFVSNDSGLMHVASAQNIPTIGLFGPTSETRTEPRGEKSFVVRAADTVPVYDVNSLHDLGDEPHSSMKKIKPEQVMSAVDQFLV